MKTIDTISNSGFTSISVKVHCYLKLTAIKREAVVC